MNRRDLLLAVLASSQGGAFTPVQIQKALFLVSRNLPHAVNQGPHFAFEPYDYGPFDRNVYLEAESLRDAGDAIIAPSPFGRWLTYSASEQGRARGSQLLAQMNASARDYIVAVSNWVRTQSFGSLVKSIYDQYPEMRANSIFQG